MLKAGEASSGGWYINVPNGLFLSVLDTSKYQVCLASTDSKLVPYTMFSKFTMNHLERTRTYIDPISMPPSIFYNMFIVVNFFLLEINHFDLAAPILLLKFY